jgi:hypothetical protein
MISVSNENGLGFCNWYFTVIRICMVLRVLITEKLVFGSSSQRLIYLS